MFLTLILYPGLTPPTNLGKAQADMIVDGCTDFGEKVTPSRFEKDPVKKVSGDLSRSCYRISVS